MLYSEQQWQCGCGYAGAPLPNYLFNLANFVIFQPPGSIPPLACREGPPSAQDRSDRIYYRHQEQIQVKGGQNFEKGS